MSDFPEQEKTELQNEEEFSTIFSDPTAHKKTAEDVKKKKLLPIIIASFLVVAVLVGGTVGVVKLIPERETETPATESKDIKVLDLTAENLKEMTVKNANGTYKFYSETKVADSSESSTSSEAKEEKVWYIEGVDKEVINTDNVANKVTSIAGVVASMEITKLTATDCGLDKPTASAELVTTDGKKHTVLLGNANLDKVSGGCYMKLADSDKIYLVSGTYEEYFSFTPLDMAKSDSLPHFDPGEEYSDYLNDDKVIEKFDTITVTGKNFKEPVVIEPTSDEDLATYAGFYVTSPTRRIAQNVEGLFEAFQKGVISAGVYSFDVSASALAAHGLDNPDFVATIKIGKSSMTYKFALQKDGNYAAIEDGGKSIRMITASNVPFGQYTTTDFYSNWVCLNGIDDLKELSIVTPDKTYTFGIAANEDEEASDKYVITYGGTKIDCQSFQDYYQQLISVTCTDYTVDSVSAAPEYSFIFKFKEGGKENRIDFIKVSETRYQYSSDGEMLGKVNASALNKVIRELQKLVG